MAAKRKKHVGAIAAALVLVLLFAVGYQLLRMREQLAAAEAERHALEERISEQKQENATLDSALEHAEDEEYLQDLARDNLGMVSPGQRDFYDVSS